MRRQQYQPIVRAAVVLKYIKRSRMRSILMYTTGLLEGLFQVSREADTALGYRACS